MSLFTEMEMEIVRIILIEIIKRKSFLFKYQVFN